MVTYVPFPHKKGFARKYPRSPMLKAMICAGVLAFCDFQWSKRICWVASMFNPVEPFVYRVPFERLYGMRAGYHPDDMEMDEEELWRMGLIQNDKQAQEKLWMARPVMYHPLASGNMMPKEAVSQATMLSRHPVLPNFGNNIQTSGLDGAHHWLLFPGRRLFAWFMVVRDEEGRRKLVKASDFMAAERADPYRATPKFTKTYIGNTDLPSRPGLEGRNDSPSNYHYP